MRTVSVKNSLYIIAWIAAVLSWRTLEWIHRLMHDILPVFKIDALMEAWRIATAKLWSQDCSKVASTKSIETIVRAHPDNFLFNVINLLDMSSQLVRESDLVLSLLEWTHWL